jgi:hypothetical protein
LDYLEWLRWPTGFVCPACQERAAWRLGDGRFKCAACGARSSVTAGTIFDRTRTPLTLWFTACWLFATGNRSSTLPKSLRPFRSVRHEGNQGLAEVASKLFVVAIRC